MLSCVGRACRCLVATTLIHVAGCFVLVRGDLQIRGVLPMAAAYKWLAGFHNPIEQTGSLPWVARIRFVGRGDSRSFACC